MDDTLERDEATQVWEWRRDELQRLGFTQKQRGELIGLIEQGELELEQVRHLIDDLHWPIEKAWWAVC